MKTKTCDERQVTGDERNIVSRRRLSAGSIVNRKSKIANELAFTLVEVLTVIAIIGVIAALIFPVASAVKRRAFIQTAQTEMSQIETAIERYHSAYGFYPPASTRTLNNVPVSQLYYELSGTFITNGNFETLDGSVQISPANVQAAFGVSGFMNCNKPGADETSAHAQDFLPDLKLSQIGAITNNGVTTSNLVTSAGGPDSDYQPCGQLDVNPWRYVYPGTNNPSSYDLWVQLKIAGQTNLICNWDSRVQINKPLP